MGHEITLVHSITQLMSYVHVTRNRFESKVSKSQIFNASDRI